MSAQPLFTIAPLIIPEHQAHWIQEHRSRHDPQFSVVEPHFTLVFAIHDLSEEVYLGHVSSVARTASRIRFHCKHAELADGHPGSGPHLYLVPDDGNQEIGHLHDRLYEGVFEPFLRRDIPYLPHITVASKMDLTTAEQLCKLLNDQGVNVEGCITSLTVGALVQSKFRPLAAFQLDA